jgi:hypothetical protein
MVFPWDLRDMNKDRLPYHAAAYRGHTNIVKLFLDAGVVYWKAERRRYKSCMRLLRERGGVESLPGDIVEMTTPRDWPGIPILAAIVFLFRVVIIATRRHHERCNRSYV